MRDKRLTDKRKRIVSYRLIGKTGILLCVIPFIPSFLLGTTLASFNDLEEGVLLTSTEWIVTSEEEVEPPEQGKQASLSFDGLTVWQDCSFIIGEVKNGGNDMTVPWEIEVYKRDGNNWVKMPDTNIFVSNLKTGEIAQFSHEPKSAGTYRFKFVREASHPGGQNGGWSDSVEFQINETCDNEPESLEEQSVDEQPEQKQEEQEKKVEIEETKPKVEEPKVEESKPKVEEPKVEESKAEEPKLEEPKEQPKAEDASVKEEPVIETSANEETYTSEEEEVDVSTSDVSDPEVADHDEE